MASDAIPPLPPGILHNEEGWPLEIVGYMRGAGGGGGGGGAEREKLEFWGPVIGTGAFATVVQSKGMYTNPDGGGTVLKEVAVKIMKLENITSSIEEMQTEVRAMKLNRHLNVLALHCCFMVGPELWLVMPFMDKGSCYYAMRKLAEKKRRADAGLSSEAVVAFVLHQVLQGLAYIHENTQIHRDIKAGNILLDRFGNVRIADFGVAGWFQKPTGARNRGEAAGAAGGGAGGGGGGGGGGEESAETRSTFVGTPCWMAPEVVESSGGGGGGGGGGGDAASPKGRGYNEKVDVWSLGITALELVKGYAPYAKYKPMEVLLKTVKEAPPSLRSYGGAAPPGFTDAFSHFVARCLQKDFEKRPSARELLSDALFTKYALDTEEGAARARAALADVLRDVPSVNVRVPGRTAEGAKTRSGGDPTVATRPLAGGKQQPETLQGTTWNFSDGVEKVMGAAAEGTGLEEVGEEGEEAGEEAYDEEDDLTIEQVSGWPFPCPPHFPPPRPCGLHFHPLSPPTNTHTHKHTPYSPQMAEQIGKEAF
jgi:serine/threonine-protein kinase OSR1/STK39